MIAQQIVILYSDIDECSASQDNCHINASCSNTEGSYGCQCVPGFTGDGFTCSSNKYNKVPWCQHHTDLYSPDIDECADSNLNNCSLNANCSDSIGSYDCTCSAGYVGDGYFCDGKSVNKLGQISFYIILFHHSIQVNVYYLLIITFLIILYHCSKQILMSALTQLHFHAILRLTAQTHSVASYVLVYKDTLEMA